MNWFAWWRKGVPFIAQLSAHKYVQSKWPLVGICFRDMCLVIMVILDSFILVIEVFKNWMWRPFARSCSISCCPLHQGSASELLRNSYPLRELSSSSFTESWSGNAEVREGQLAGSYCENDLFNSLKGLCVCVSRDCQKLLLFSALFTIENKNIFLTWTV